MLRLPWRRVPRARPHVALLLIALLGVSPGCLFPPVEVLAGEEGRLPVGIQNTPFTVEDSQTERRALVLTLAPPQAGALDLPDRHVETFELPPQLTYLAVHLEWADDVLDLDLAVLLATNADGQTWTDADDRGNVGTPDKNVTLATRDTRCDTPLCSPADSTLTVTVTSKAAVNDLPANLTVTYDHHREVVPVVGRFDAVGDTRVRVGEIETTSQDGRWIARRTIEIEDDPKSFHARVRELALVLETGGADVTVTSAERFTVLLTVRQEASGANRDAAVRGIGDFQLPYQNALSKGNARLSLSLGLQVQDDDWRGKKASIEALVPPGYEQVLRARTTTGALAAKNLSAPQVGGLAVDLGTTNGEIRVEGYDLATTGTMRLASHSGTIVGRQVDARGLEVDTTSGASDLRGMRLADLAIASASGTHTTFGVDVTTVDISVGEGAFEGTLTPRVSSSWRLDATSGALRLDLDGGARAGYDITADTESGSVRIRCKGDPWVESRSARTERHCGADPGDPALDVGLTTTVGNIAVREV